MKIYILPVNEDLQPTSTWLKYDHVDDYGVEQDFLKYLYENDSLLTKDPLEADYHFLPIFWYRWFANHDWGQSDRDKLQMYIDQAVLNDSKTFTICQSQYWGRLGEIIVFCASRRGGEIDLPLICKPHQVSMQLPEKKYLASFIGRLETHSIRTAMAECFQDVQDTYIVNHSRGVDFFVETILKSYITLCPRGSGGSSYRFYETMQLGVVPLLIGIPDTRPFKKYICWDEYSFYAETPNKAVEIVERSQKSDLLAMGRKCARLWNDHLSFGKWCGYVLKELSDLKK